MSLKLNSSGGGSVTLQEPATASNFTLNLPAVDGTVVSSDSSGNVGIGTNSPLCNLDVVSGSGTVQRIRSTANSGANTLYQNSGTGTTGSDGLYVGIDTTAGYLWNWENQPLVFATNATERMRIDGSGRIGINSAPAAWIGNEQLYVAGTSSLTNQFVGNIAVGSSSPSGACALFLNYTAAAPNNTSNSYLICNDNSGVQKLNIFSNGTVSNRTGTYNSLSDLKLKENVVDATPKLDKLMQTKVRNYNLIGDELKQIGFIAQELEQVFPGLVEDVPDFDENQQPTGEVTKMVKTSVLIPILVKAVQELKAELDSAKAEIAELKAKVGN